mmetsp:Transcript_28372/g.87778  ORF Transcript_28372/g.87778 Transcript_28372/m.87778 type:complete len:204 (-) Transcript_28372:60-671(-)
MPSALRLRVCARGLLLLRQQLKSRRNRRQSPSLAQAWRRPPVPQSLRAASLLTVSLPPSQLRRHRPPSPCCPHACRRIQQLPLLRSLRRHLFRHRLLWCDPRALLRRGPLSIHARLLGRSRARRSPHSLARCSRLHPLSRLRLPLPPCRPHLPPPTYSARLLFQIPPRGLSVRPATQPRKTSSALSLVAQQLSKGVVTVRGAR